ncbi:MAG TPA: EutN/CcmL family microcompartment protein [Vicinamibacteria bacterium]|jgi:ethanolamine utilization protein EutN
MQLAKVVGNVVATVKDPSLESEKLLVIQPVAASGAPRGAPLVALDSVGVGVGESVFFVRGREAALAFLPRTVLADATVVGKVDAVTLEPAPRSPRPERRAPRRASEERARTDSRSESRSEKRPRVGPRRTEKDRGEH